MEFFVWALVISILLLFLMVPLAIAVGGLALIVNAIKNLFNLKN